MVTDLLLYDHTTGAWYQYQRRVSTYDNNVYYIHISLVRFALTYAFFGPR